MVTWLSLHTKFSKIWRRVLAHPGEERDRNAAEIFELPIMGLDAQSSSRDFGFLIDLAQYANELGDRTGEHQVNHEEPGVERNLKRARNRDEFNRTTRLLLSLVTRDNPGLTLVHPAARRSFRGTVRELDANAIFKMRFCFIKLRIIAYSFFCLSSV